MPIRAEVQVEAAVIDSPWLCATQRGYPWLYKAVHDACTSRLAPRCHETHRRCVALGNSWGAIRSPLVCVAQLELSSACDCNVHGPLVVFFSS